MKRNTQDTPWRTLERHANRHALAQERNKHMPTISETYTSSSQSLKVEDLQKKKVSLTIKDVQVKKFDEQPKFVVAFEETEKTFVLNKTNAHMMEMLTDSEDSDDWIGVRITLKPSMTEFQGKPTPCIRICDELPEQKKRAARPAPKEEKEEIPF